MPCSSWLSAGQFNSQSPPSRVSGAIAQQLLETVPHDLDSAREALIDIQNASTSIPQVLESLRRSFGNKSQREPKFVDVTR